MIKKFILAALAAVIAFGANASGSFPESGSVDAISGASVKEAGKGIRSDTLKVLAIGNSFSADPMEQDLWGIANAAGQPMVLGDIKEDSLEKHLDHAKNGKPYKKYWHCINGEMTTVDGMGIKEILESDDWDVVTLQQVSQDAPDFSTYEPFLGELIQYVKEHTKKDVRILWHMTWAYETGDRHSTYTQDVYGGKSLPMYLDIVICAKKVQEKYGLEVIPTGTAIQNLRTGFTREQTTRDGWHLSTTMSRYTASCVWFEKLTGKYPYGNTYVPPTLKNRFRRESAWRTAHTAIEHPFEVTSMLSGRGQFGSAESGPFDKDYLSDVKCDLPDPLKMQDGRAVTTAEQWMKERRPELLELFRTEVYGHSAPRQEGQHYKVVAEDNNAFGGLATRKEITVFYTANEEAMSMQLLLYVPNGVKGPVPAFVFMNHTGNIAVNKDEGILPYSEVKLKMYGVYGTVPRGFQSEWFPLEMILARGYAFATFFKGDCDPDFDDGFRNGIQPFSYRSGQFFPDPDQWGSISAWAWGYSRVLDYLQTDKSIDAAKVIAIGHSRSGKTALWASAQDERFAMAISNDSGCGGAAISRRKMGQTLRSIQTTFPNWFCTNYLKYMENEEALPVDQHELISLIAPRPVYVASASRDFGADPKGEFLSEVGAMPVYQLFGYKGLESVAFPQPQTCISGDHMGYHLRNGKHGITAWDWSQYLDFADKYLKH